MTALIIGIMLVGLVVLMVGYRMIKGPDDANRAVASDLLFFSMVGMFAMVGALRESRYVFDVVLVATLVGFLASVSLARSITRGER